MPIICYANQLLAGYVDKILAGCVHKVVAGYVQKLLEGNVHRLVAGYVRKLVAGCVHKWAALPLWFCDTLLGHFYTTLVLEITATFCIPDF